MHNFGVINKSDAVKLRKLCKRQVDGDVQVEIRKSDFWYLKLFMLEVAEVISIKVHQRLSVLLSTILATEDVAKKQSVAQEVANKFQLQTTIAGETRTHI